MRSGKFKLHFLKHPSVKHKLKKDFSQNDENTTKYSSSIGPGCKIAPDWEMGAIERLGSHSRKFAPLNFSGNCHEQMLIMFAKDISPNIKVDSGFVCKCYPLQMLRLSRLLR